MSHGAYTAARLINWQDENWAIGGDPENLTKLIKRINLIDYDWIGGTLGNKAKRN